MTVLAHAGRVADSDRLPFSGLGFDLGSVRALAANVTWRSQGRVAPTGRRVVREFVPAGYALMLQLGRETRAP